MRANGRKKLPEDSMSEAMKKTVGEIKSDIIYDVGLHVGQDTDFYLKKGFKVIAFETLSRSFVEVGTTPTA